jgi:hypothetical protein
VVRRVRSVPVAEAADQGRRLEQSVAGFFAGNGYTTRCNDVLVGRSGGPHEIDVLAEKSDALTTFRVAIECKAWQQPIEKDVVSKLHYIVGDLGLSKGIVVSLAGCRSGAERTADDLGIELWGPDELRRHLGDAVVAELGTPPTAPSSTLSWGYAFAVGPEQGQRAIRSTTKGRLGLRTLEDMVYFTALWMPAYCIRVTVAQPEVKRSKTRLRSTTVDNLYEALSGSWLGRAAHSWEQVEIEQRLALRPSHRDTKVHSSLRKAFSSYERVSSPAALERHAGNLAQLGVRTPCSSLSIESTALVHLPFFAGVLEADGRHRVAAVAGHTGTVSNRASEILTTNLPLLRSHFAA